MVTSEQFMKIVLNPWISLDVSVHLTSKSWSSMFVELQIIITMKMTLGWMMIGDRYPKRSQP